MEHTLSIHDVTTRRRELFYWSAILCTFALGTAAGDLATEALGLDFVWCAVVFGALIALTYAVWRMGGNAVLTFWIAYILTRLFGAALGDLLTQDKAYGGLGIGAMWTSTLFLTVIIMLVAVALIGTQGPIPLNLPFEGLDDWMEAKQLSYKAQKVQEQAARDIRDNARRVQRSW